MRKQRKIVDTQGLTFILTYCFISIFSFQLKEQQAQEYSQKLQLIYEENDLAFNRNENGKEAINHHDENIYHYLSPEAINSLNKTFIEADPGEQGPQWQKAIHFINKIFTSANDDSDLL